MSFLTRGDVEQKLCDGCSQVSVNPLPATGHKDTQSSVTTSKEDYEKAGAFGAAGAAIAGGAAYLGRCGSGDAAHARADSARHGSRRRPPDDDARTRRR